MTRAVAAAVIAAAALGCGGSDTARPAGPARRRAPCPTAPVVISSQAEVDALAGCRTVPGLAIRTAAALDTAHLSLTAVTGDLAVGPSVGLEQLVLPALARVGGALRVVGNGSMTTVSLPALAAAGSVVVEGNVELRLIRLPVLAAVAGDLRIARAASLGMVDAPALAAIGGALSIVEAPGLDVIEVPRLTQAGTVEITRTDLTADQLQALHAIAAAAPPR